jgi:HEAT repeat protein/predicted negative regulator of RcsB-dependent stress response
MIMKRFICVLWLLWIVLTQARLAPAQETMTVSETTTVSPEAQFQSAQKLQSEGHETEAFLQYLAIPGAEHAAVALARNKATQFLEILRTQAGNVPLHRIKMVEGDLLLAVGKKQEALAAYREAVTALNKEDTTDGSGSKLLPTSYYPVEPPTVVGRDEQTWYRGESPLMPFTVGSGSHRDNWMIRRFIALEAWDDAAAEFARVWEIHRRNTQPYIITLPVYNPDSKESKPAKFLVMPAGFDSRGLQFAIDYAYFLKRRQQTEEALAILLEPLRLMDMDDNPNSRRTEPVRDGETPRYPERRDVLPVVSRRWGFDAGMSRKEFVRLAFGEYKTLGKADQLIAILQSQIANGENRTRRVLATVRLHEGKPDEALALELAYIKSGSFDELTSTYRSGLVYEDFQKLAEAAEHYEKALALPFKLPQMPDRDEEAAQARAAIAMFRPDRENGQIAFQAQVLARLQRIYGALGKTNRVLDITLRQFEVNAALLENVSLLEQAEKRFEAAKQEARFMAWAKERLRDASSPMARASLSWVLDDLQGTIRALMEVARKSKDGDAAYRLNEWKDRFRKKGKAQIRTLLAALVQAEPADAYSRLELLDLENRFAEPELVRTLEDLLQSYSEEYSGHGRLGYGGQEIYNRRGAYSRTQFKSQYDLAYRLMRLYEKSGQIGKLQQLGLRIARGEKPFDKPDEEQYTYRDGNDVPEHANACLALAVLYANDAAAQQKLAEALAKSPWIGARAQLTRRVARQGKTPWVTPALAPFGWVNVPDGVTVLAGSQNVLSLCRDNRRIYAGHPWGVAAYDFKGNPVTRVALGTAALHLAVCGNGLWAGTPAGLNRIDLVTFAVSYLPCNQEIDPQEKARGPQRSSYNNRVTGLAARGDVLWIGTNRDVRTFNTRTKALRIFSGQEIGYSRDSATDRFLFDGQYVWIDGDAGCRRYDTRTGTWNGSKSPQKNENEPLHLIGVVDGKIWGNVWLNDELRSRPCIIDRATLKITPILIADNDLPRAECAINGPFSFYGRYKGHLVFGSKWPAYVLDAATGKLRSMKESSEEKAFSQRGNSVESDVPVGLRTGTLWRRFDGAVVCEDDITHQHKLGKDEFITGEWTMLRLPDGTRVLGGSHPSSPDYSQPSQEWPFNEMPRETEDGSGGLHFLSVSGQVRHVSAAPRPDTLHGDVVFAAVPDTTSGSKTNGWVWLCTNYGLAAVNPQHRVVATVTRRNGLLGNRVTSGVSTGGKLYFATRWGDNGGGLIVYHPRQAVFTSLTEVDGLAANSLQNIAVPAASQQSSSQQSLSSGPALTLTYGVQYRRWADYKYQQYPPGTYRPAAGVFSPVPEPRIMTQQEAGKLPRGKGLGTIPYLGGLVLSRQVIEGKTWLCGTRGVVILNAKAPSSPAVPTIMARVMLDPRQVQLAQAKKRKVDITSPAALAQALKDSNPFYRAEALSSVYGKDTVLAAPVTMPLVASQLNDPEVRVRSTALYLVSLSKDDKQAVPLLQQRLSDGDDVIRAFATAYLLQHGHIPDLKRLREILEQRDSVGSLPFGATSSIDFVDRQKLYEAVAPHATPEVFALLMEFPPRIGDYDNKTKVFPQLGSALRGHPGAASLLLKAYDEKRYETGQRDFARDVFRFAGKPLLPVLHQALASPDRVVRSNAARACGAIGDTSSIPFLIKALDLESGLSRASVVWALGELKAAAALPQLVELYVEARNDESRRGGSGFRAAQSAAVMNTQYTSINTQYLANNASAAQNSQIETLKNLDAVGNDWNELKASMVSGPIDPRRNEELLAPKHILEAVRKIGPVVSQEFYRALAGTGDTTAREEAAERLAEGGQDDIARNLPILRNLLADAAENVRMAAAVSLLIMGQKEAQPPILEWLDAAQAWQRSAILDQLKRVDDAAQLAFAHPKIAAIAADTAESDDLRQLARALL